MTTACRSRRPVPTASDHKAEEWRPILEGVETFLIVLGTVFVLWVLVMVVGFLLVRRELDRRNRVVPHAASPAPPV